MRNNAWRGWREFLATFQVSPICSAEIRLLPPPNYSEKQWEILCHIFLVLRHAVGELGAVFAEQGAVDFIEIGMAALQVLRERRGQCQGASTPARRRIPGHLAQPARIHRRASPRLEHGSGSGARPAHSFVVGDPMQSIYMFRQADVELFDLVREHGFATGDGCLASEEAAARDKFSFQRRRSETAECHVRDRFSRRR